MTATVKPPPRMTTETTEEIISPTALSEIERANIDMQITTAKKYPRHFTTVKKRMLELATLDQETAAACFYKLSRENKKIEGPSIRMAEIAASCWGNLRAGARVIKNDGKKITGQAYCHDLETNVFWMIETDRRITYRGGGTYSDDMQIVTGNAACAIAARNALFKVIPFALIKPILTEAKRVAVGDAKTLSKRRDEMLQKFTELRVDARRICTHFNRAGIEEITLDDLEELIGLYTAIRDGDSTVDESFPIVIASAKFPEDTPPTAATKTEVTPQPKTAEPEKKKAEPTLKRRSEVPSPEKATATDTIQESAAHKAFAALLAVGKFTREDFVALALHEGWIDPEIASWDKIPVARIEEFMKEGNLDFVMQALEERRAAATPKTEATATHAKQSDSLL